MNYRLDTASDSQKKAGTLAAVRSLWPLLREEKSNLIFAFAAILVNSAVNLSGPYLIGRTVDKYVLSRNFHGVMVSSSLLLGLFLIGLVASYLQTMLMGSVSQRALFKLRATVFNKLQDLPVAFFYQNKAGDLISRINNDTDKLNQFFSQSLMQFVGSIFIMFGAAIFLLALHFQLGVATLAPAAIVLLFTQLLSPWIKRKNALSLQKVGDMSAEIQESLNNFKVIVAFNRRDYFRKKFEEFNKANYNNAIAAGLANTFFAPIYSFASTVGQLIVLTFGIYLILHGRFSLGLLISFLSYSNNFYNPLRQLAALWANFQTALAGWDRITAILAMKSDMVTVPLSAAETIDKGGVLTFKGVSFSYPAGKEVLHDIHFTLEEGKTYALVGPTGGGKTTTASLMARIFDPTLGKVFFHGRDIRSYPPEERAQKIGFILQEPFLFTGTVGENIRYGNEQYSDYNNEQLEKVIKDANLQNLLAVFDKGLGTGVQVGSDSISLGQRQLVAFLRAVLRNPDILILDEATANIDTVTEQLLDEILRKLPKKTTRVIIAHRLNTIDNADEIFFVNGGEILPAGSMEHAVDLLLHKDRKS
ncbi:MAG: transporter ATP-binding protein [Verrucomicrobiales bacterium]|nr:transporter ATP-binding protein [Verrucomicrobiales bacterium]